MSFKEPPVYTRDEMSHILDRAREQWSKQSHVKAIYLVRGDVHIALPICRITYDGEGTVIEVRDYDS